jgi:hypothetical protein
LAQAVEVLRKPIYWRGKKMDRYQPKLASLLNNQTLSDLANLEHSALYNLRNRAPGTLQNLIAPYEHRAFAREATAENPLMALPIAAAIPLYSGAKALGLIKTRSEPSLSEIGQGYLGIGEGIGKYLGLLSK